MAKLIVDIIAEQVKEKHIAENVHQAAVQKGIGHELPEVGLIAVEHKVEDPRPELQTAAARVYVIFQQQNDRIDENQGVIDIWRPSWRNTRPNRQ